jgi:hypothetical protein
MANMTRRTFFAACASLAAVFTLHRSKRGPVVRDRTPHKRIYNVADEVVGIRAASQHLNLMGGWYGLDEKQTDALVDELEALARYREAKGEGFSDAEAREDAWPSETALVRWHGASAEVANG